MALWQDFSTCVAPGGPVSSKWCFIDCDSSCSHPVDCSLHGILTVARASAFLTSLVYQDETRPASAKQIITGDKDSCTKDTEMVDLIKNTLFWHALTQYFFRHLFGMHHNSNKLFLIAPNDILSRWPLRQTSRRLHSAALMRFS